jgi:hypothetical protein
VDAESEAYSSGLDEVEDEIRRLLDKVSKPLPKLLSKSHAARLLGVSRGRTLGPLIERGLIRTVLLGKRVKIPLSEIERIQHEGAAVPEVTPLRVRMPAAPVARTRPPNLQDELARARALRI